MKLKIGENDFESYCRKNNLEYLLSEWDYEKNNKREIYPFNVTSHSSKKIAWKIIYVEKNTNKSFVLEWDATINNRVRGCGCPYLVGKKVLHGFNDLESYCQRYHLDYILDEWDYEHNNVKPKDIVYGSNLTVNWVGKICKHNYKQKISNRVLKHSNCPICMKEYQTSFPEQSIYYYVKKYFIDAINRDTKILNGVELDIYIPSKNIAIEYDGEQWHQDKIKDEKKNKLCEEKNILLFRIRESNCWFEEETNYLKNISCQSNNICDLENAIKSLLFYLNIMSFDVNINRDCSEIYSLYISSIKEQSLAEQYPDVLSEWDFKKNKISPYAITYGSNKMVWWKCKLNHSYLASVNSKTKKIPTHCPYCVGQKILIGFNDLQTINPILASQWHPTKNGTLKPTNVTINSAKKVWWLLSYDDPKTGKHFDFEWESFISNRKTNGSDCPYLSGHLIWIGYNDLATTHPQLANEWNYHKNGNLKPTDVTANSNKKVWWLLPYDDPKTGKHFDFEWEATIALRTSQNTSCPYLTGNAICVGFNDLATIYPQLANEWNYHKNGSLKPTDVTINSRKKVWWILHYYDSNTQKYFDFEWEAIIYNRTRGSGCPYLQNQKLFIGYNDLETKYPNITTIWNYKKNGDLKPSNVIVSSNDIVWWVDSDNVEYKLSIRNQIKRYNRKMS